MNNKAIMNTINDRHIEWFWENSSDLVCSMNLKGVILKGNPVFINVIGLDPKEETISIFDIWSSKSYKEVIELIKRTIESSNSIVTTEKTRHKNGALVICKWSIMYDPHYMLFYLIGKKETTSCLGWCEAFLSTTNDPVYILNHEGKIINVNEAFAKVYGWSLDELLGTELPTIPHHLRGERTIFSEILQLGSRVRNYKTIRQKKDGSLIHAIISVTPVKDSNGKVVAIVGVTRNITDKVEAALLLDRKVKELKEHEVKFLEISENINEIFCVFDFSMNEVVYVSPSYERILGHSKEAFYKNFHIIYQLVHEEDLEAFKHFLKSTDTDSEIEYRIFHKNGNIKWLRSRKTPIKDKKYLHRVATVTQDISSLKEKELLLNKQDKLGAIGQLAAGIAHEVRNPLTAIKGFAQLWGQETHNKYSEIILSELERIESIMQEFLILAKPNQETKFEVHDINRLVNETIDFMHPEALLHKVELMTDITQELPLVKLEKKQIKQVMLNLIKNAIDSMPNGGHLLVKTKHLGEEYICIEVIDEGIGIAQDRIPRLGEPFYSNKEKGTGLGLMVSFKIIEHHKGKIIFESEEAKGTKVQVRLPINVN
ncbi:PAS domain-containing sensor histidine kinase [Bacillus sp. Hm123]|uniref:PAS domain-containing sensor histidine kinase n=1 Tax=Bacillus sp. Hm123 TaxID=3450745 RepID=UPI003F422D7C